MRGYFIVPEVKFEFLFGERVLYVVIL
uniref:Uncharacterized protein n=1 Tax=Arundo donax TaxID=35708 RepID=A0A0A8Z8A3_ARUDO